MKHLFLMLLISFNLLLGQYTDETYDENNLNYFKKPNIEFSFKVIPKAELEYFLINDNFTRFCTQKDTADYKLGSIKTRVGLDFNYGPFILYFDNHVYMNPSKGNFSFSPIHIDFYSGLSVDITKDIKIKFEHLCKHPIISYNNQTNNIMFGGHNSIKLSYGY